jgi:hypothetical protein
MNTVTALLTNGAYGFPRGHERRVKPTILACLHQTANTATAMQERGYANRAGSPGPSATAYVDHDGTVVRAVLPAKYAAWSQGDVQSPDMSIPTVAAAVRARPAYNVNEWVYESIEVCGRGAEPYDDAQFEAVAQLVAAASRVTGLPVSRSTVITHRDVNGVDRASDPWPASTREARVRRVIDRANAILHPAPRAWTLQIARGVRRVRVATVVAGRIVRWSDRPWSGLPSSAPCAVPLRADGTLRPTPGLVSGSAPVVHVTAGVFAKCWVRLDDGVSVRES